MKQVCVVLLFCISFLGSDAQNVGIGTLSPVAGLHMVSNNGIIVSGTLNTGAVLNQSGPASLLLFNTKKGAFRVGYLDGVGADFWNDASTGLYSIGMGYNSKAVGSNSVAIGQNALASLTNSLAIGYASQALASNSIAISGVGSNANEQFSVAIGNFANANSYGSVAIGRNLTAGYTTTIGQNTYAIGIGDNAGYVVGGHYATGNRAFVFGNNCRSVGNQAFALGNDCVAGKYFEDGSVGTYSFAMGNTCKASGNYSFAFGNNANTNDHQGSMVLGSRIDGITVLSPGDFHLLAQFAGGYQFQSNNAGTLGVYLQPNTSAWQSLCDSTKKEQVLPMQDETTLKKLAAINYASWKYKDDPDASNRHYGIMAQDFHAAFGKDALGTIGSDTLVNPIDLIGVAYSAIKALEKRTDEIREVKNENELLKARLEKLEAAIAEKRNKPYSSPIPPFFLSHYFYLGQHISSFIFGMQQLNCILSF